MNDVHRKTMAYWWKRNRNYEFQLHVTIEIKWNYKWINYNHNNIAIRSHVMIYVVCKICFLLPNLVAFISQKEKNVWLCDYHLLTYSVRKMVLMRLMQNIDYVFVVSISSNQNECVPRNKKMLLNLVAKMKFYTFVYIIKWLRMAIL